MNNTLDSIAKARALYYDFFAGMFLYELLSIRADVLVKQVVILKENALSESDSLHFEILQKELETYGVERILLEYTYTFIIPFGLARRNSPEVKDTSGSDVCQKEMLEENTLEENAREDEPESLPQIELAANSKKKKYKSNLPQNTHVMLYLSHYLEGCLNGKSLLKIKQLIKQGTFRLNTEECKESEEHLGFLLLLARHLLLSHESKDRSLSADVIYEFIFPLSDFVIKALVQREDLRYYKSVGILLNSFLSFERSLNLK